MNSEITPQPEKSVTATSQGVAAAGLLLHRINPALAAAVAALALIGWQWLDTRSQINALEQTVGKRLGEFDSRSKESATAAGLAHEDTKQALVKVGLLEQKLAESQNQQVALEAMYQELSRNRDEWVLTEIEQILLTASQQLQLAGDARAALVALQTADSRLQRNDKPQFIALRKAIIQDILRLQALPLVDVAGYTLKLDGLIAAVDDLPLVVGEEIPVEGGSTKMRPEDNLWTKLTREIWQDMKQLVRIQNMENPEAPLLPPSQAYFLRENLKLRLLSARLAVLRHDEPGFKSDLKIVEVWLRRYFDIKGKAGKNILATVKQLSTSPVAIELPDISASLNAAKSFKLSNDRGGR